MGEDQEKIESSDIIEDEPGSKPRKAGIVELLGSSHLPMIVWVIVFTTLMACFYAGESFAFYTVGGYAWIMAFVFSALILIAKIARACFPLLIWMPWIVFVGIYSYTSDFPNLQRTILLLCPLVVGMAASTSRINEAQVAIFRLVMKLLVLAIIIIIIVLTGMLLTGMLPDRTAFAPQAITTLVLSAVFISGYSFGNIKDLIWYVISAMVPIIALTRGPIVVTGLMLPLSFSPIKIQIRLVMLVLVALIGLALFYSPRIQKKMFYSGEGSLGDVMVEKMLATSGRRNIADLMALEIAKEPIWGHGANASESFVYNLTGSLTHPHNDWLRFLYDYGIVGTALYALTLLFQVRHLLRFARRAGEETRVLFYAAASSFLAFVFIMLTDNVVLYAAYFGNLQFTIIGLAYAAERQRRYEESLKENEEGDDDRPRHRHLRRREMQ
jgi:O-antigen ligase